MALLEKQLEIRKSNLAGAGKGLFTKKAISKGTRIVEYKGKVTTWKEAKASEDFNGYIYYINRNHVIDAKPGRYSKAFARYANDARGISRIDGLSNNATYVIDNGKVYIEAIKNIPAGSEIFVSYGKEYWDVVRFNNKLDAKKL